MLDCQIGGWTEYRIERTVLGFEPVQLIYLLFVILMVVGIAMLLRRGKSWPT